MANTREKADKVKKDSGKVTITVPLNVLGEDDDEYIDACVNGRIYQVKCGEPVEVPRALAEALENAIAQKRKIDKEIKNRANKSVKIEEN